MSSQNFKETNNYVRFYNPVCENCRHSKIRFDGTKKDALYCTKGDFFTNKYAHCDLHDEFIVENASVMEDEEQSDNEYIE